MVCNVLHKRPCALYLTQENDNEETLQRVFSYIGAVQKRGNADEDDLSLEEKMIAHKLLDSKWAFVIKYRKKGSINTNDIDSIINEIEAEDDVEVKLLVHDYIKRLKANIPVGDIRLDLGEALNDLSILAKSRKIPVVTANQLNREAYKTLGDVATKANEKENNRHKKT
jgi:replicative DNA helicase